MEFKDEADLLQRNAVNLSACFILSKVSLDSYKMFCKIFRHLNKIVIVTIRNFHIMIIQNANIIIFLI